MKMLDLAIYIAVKAHSDQVDKAGQPYILHPLRVMCSLEDEADQVIAVLHDILEDGSAESRQDLINARFPTEVYDALHYLTKKDTESYDTYIQRIKGNLQAVRVKIADLNDNMTHSRVLQLLHLATNLDETQAVWSRFHRYRVARMRLQDFLENDT